MNELPYLPRPTLHAKTSYEDAVAALHEVAAKAPEGMVRIKSAGKTRTGREMVYAEIGSGPERIWVQCRGRAIQKLTTPAGIEIVQALTSTAYQPLHDKFTLQMIPLFVPDCTDKNLDYTDGDAVDMEKDWRDMNAPESLNWFALWKAFKPDYVINLHQMGYWPFIEGTTLVNNFQIFTNLLRPEEFHGDQWDVNRRIAIVAADAVKALGENPGRFWNERWYHLNEERYLSNQGAMLQGFPDKDRMQRVRGTVYFELRKDLGSENDSDLVRIHVAATLAVIQALATGYLHQVPLSRYEEIPYGTHYTWGKEPPEWLASGEMPEWVRKKEYPKEFVERMIKGAVQRGFVNGEHPEIRASKEAGLYKEPYSGWSSTPVATPTPNASKG